MSSFIKLARPYLGWVFLVTILGIAANGLALYIPKISAGIIDQAIAFGSAGQGIVTLVYVAIATLLVAVIQIYSSTFFSEKVALELRHKLIRKVGGQSFGYISSSTPGRLLTVFTSDVDAVKDVIAQGISALLSAGVTLIGSAVLLLLIQTKLALYTLSVIPLLILSVVFIFGSLTVFFKKSQENVERINALINETIVGAALIRVLHATSAEMRKFTKVNTEARKVGLSIVSHISALIPIITLLANAAVVIILWFGGKSVIAGTLSIGDFSAFLSYSAMFVWPIFVLSFVGTMISRGAVSLTRINEVLDAPVIEEKGEYDGEITGKIEFKNVTLKYPDGGGEKTVLKNISFTILPGTKNAIVGPTAAGKTQLFYLMAGLVAPTEGEILIDGRPLTAYKSGALLSRIGLVFQDSIMFNTTFRENIALSEKTPTEMLTKAINTSELDELVAALPQGMETLVSERGTSLSGGQKQRLMLARALAIDPQILLLDDFTARVDQATEVSILKNVATNYQGVTLISITQKIQPITAYDQIIVVMEGELVAVGVHKDLLKDSFEYRQIYESQQSTETISS